MKHTDRVTSSTTSTTTRGYWIATSLFALQMGFTAYAQLRLPQVAEAFTHLGFPDYFRVELSWLELAGIIVLLLRQRAAGEEGVTLTSRGVHTA